MVSAILKRAAAITVALATFLICSPGMASPMSLRAYAQQNVRVATIAYRISTAAATNCTEPQMVTGLMLHDLSGYDRAVRPAVSRAFTLGAGVGVMQIVQGSAADRAGLRPDDEILSMNGRSVEDYLSINQSSRSSRRLEAFSRTLQTALSFGPARLEIRRNGTIKRLWLRGEPGCGGEPSLNISRSVNAWSDGKHVVVTSAMMQLAQTNDELAFVVAHEMAHNILGHSRGSRRGIFGLNFGGKRQELAADYVAVWLMTEGGYKAEGGITFLRTVGRRFPLNLSLDHPGVGKRLRTVAEAINSVAHSPLWARAHTRPLMPTFSAQLNRTIAASESPSTGPPTGTALGAEPGSSWANEVALT